MSQPYADFGVVVAPTDIDDAALATLKVWLPTYMRQLEVERSLQYQLARPKVSGYANALEDTEFLDRALPAVIVTTAQTDSDPSIAADGTYLATWRMVVSCIVRGQTAARTRELASYMEASIRRVLVQHTSLGDKVHTLRWMGAQIAPLPDQTKQGRYLAAGIGTYRVWTQNTVQEAAGPSVPDSDPYADSPLVTSIDSTLTADPVGGDVHS